MRAHGVVVLFVASVGVGCESLGLSFGESSTSPESRAAGASEQPSPEIPPAIAVPSEDPSVIASRLCGVATCPTCVVLIEVETVDAGRVNGTGVLLEDGRVLTAAHVTQCRRNVPTPTLKVIFGGRDGHEEVDGAANTRLYISWTDEALRPGQPSFGLPQGGDLSVIYGVKPPAWARGAKLALTPPMKGDLLISIGLEQPDAVRVHAAPMVDREGNTPFLQIGVTAQAGDSGGPVFNKDGYLVGINTAIGSASKMTYTTNRRGSVINLSQYAYTAATDLSQMNHMLKPK